MVQSYEDNSKILIKDGYMSTRLTRLKKKIFICKQSCFTYNQDIEFL